MKATLRIPTQEPFAFIEVEYEGDEIGTEESLVSKYNDFTRLVKPQKGLDVKEWREALDSLGLGNPLPVEAFEAFSDMQRWCYHEFEKMLARISKKTSSDFNLEKYHG